VDSADLLVLVLAVLGLVLAAVAVVLALQVRRAVRRRASASAAHAPFDTEPVDRPLAAVVVNPTKFADVAPLRAALERACADLGWAEPLWLETTADDPGIGQTRAALDAGADLVAACGGDGTVRCVAQVLAGTGTALGLVPAGTGNLLARNLDVVISRAAEIAPDDAEAAMRVALTGDDRPIDVGWVTVVGPHGEVHDAPEERAFLVMAGMGFDAAIMANAPEALKAKVGPIAYFVSGLQHFNGERVRMAVTVDGQTHHRRVRTVVVGNVGRLQGGLTLMPDAEVDDGWLDVLAIGPSGLIGWVDVAGRLITRRRRRDARLDTWRGRDIELRVETPQPAQLDGDPVGDAVALRMRIDEGALLVRVAAGVSPRRPRGRSQSAAPARSRDSHSRAAVKSASAVPGGGVGARPSARG
jgi:diacylglycerol kinase family enzyme